MQPFSSLLWLLSKTTETDHIFHFIPFFLFLNRISLISFIAFVLRFSVGYGLELSRIVPLITFHIKRKYFCKTEAEVKEAWRPGDLGYRTRVPGDLLIVTIVLSYSVIAPMIIPFGVAYFGLGWLILRNQVMPYQLASQIFLFSQLNFVSWIEQFEHEKTIPEGLKPDL